MSEALAIVSEGLATPEAMNRIVKTSFGLRLSAFEPFEVCDQAGPDVYNTIFKCFYKELSNDVILKDQFIKAELVKQPALLELLPHHATALTAQLRRV